MAHYRAFHRGFSFIEISLVLVIVAFLIGTIFSGQTMLRNQRIKQIPAMAAQFHVASTQFRQKYQYFPGDMPNAWATWSAAPWSLGISTNGDGNGLIDNNEYRYAWEQLVAGGFIVGPYGHNSSQTPNVDIPAGVIEGTGYAFSAANSPTGLVAASTVNSFAGDYTAAIYYGKSLLGATRMKDPGISGEDAWHVDTVYDDGLPGTGSIITWPTAPVTNSCYDIVTTTYLSTTKDLACALIFLNPYLKRFQ